jgi:cytochrome c553
LRTAPPRVRLRQLSSLKPHRNIRVVKTDRVPKTYVANWFLAIVDSRETEPIGQRIIDTPENVEQLENRDPRSTFVAYVPKGSLVRGADIVNGRFPAKTFACSACHGKNLTGQGSVPPIAGRSPSYIYRQLYEFQAGIRGGQGSEQMKEPVAHLTSRDMLSIAAYLASLNP